MNRKQFITQLAGLAAIPVFSKSLLAQSSVSTGTVKRVTILHTNDTHARIDPFPDEHPKYAGLAGFARRAAYVKQVRAENKHTLLLDSGDVFQGTPYFNLFKGKLDYQLMSQLGYDATTLGNHEFDNGVDGLLDAMQELTFPMVNSNYQISDKRFENQIKNYLIKDVNGVKIGIFGLGIDFQSLVLADNHKGFVYRDAISVGNGISSNLKKYLHCDYVICLSHIGYEYPNDPKRSSDIRLAKETEHIDLILGGHTHTFLEKPVTIQNKVGKEVIINQVGFSGIHLGHLELFFNEENKLATMSASAPIISANMA